MTWGPSPGQPHFANIAYLVPGTEPVEPSDPTKARITAVSFGGSSGLNDVNSVDGGDNSDDYIGGFLQNFSPDAVQEFAVQTSQQNADIGRTVGDRSKSRPRADQFMARRSGFLRTRRGAERALSHRESSAAAQTTVLPAELYRDLRRTHRQGQALVLRRDEAVHEDASIAYSPASLTQFNALAGLASQGLIPGIQSIPVPNNVPIPFRDYLGDLRFDWAQSTRSQWYLAIRGGVLFAFLLDLTWLVSMLASLGQPGNCDRRLLT